MNAIANHTVLQQPTECSLEGPIETLVSEYRTAVAINNGVTIWHYIPNYLWAHVEGRMDELAIAALHLACRDEVRALLREKLPEWMLLGTPHKTSEATVGSLFCMIVYDDHRREDAEIWLNEVFTHKIAPALMVIFLERAAGMLAKSPVVHSQEVYAA